MFSRKMDSDKIKDIIANTVQSLTSVVTEAVTRSQNRPSSSRGNTEGIEEPSRKKMRTTCPLPSRFLKKGKGKARQAVKIWSKDIVCLPHDSLQANEIAIPRGLKRTQLARKGLIGKVSISST